MNFNDKVALAAHYHSVGMNNAKIAKLLRVDASSVSRYLRQAAENSWLEQRVYLHLPPIQDAGVRATIRDTGLEEDLFRFFAAQQPKSGRSIKLQRDGFVVARTPAASDEPAMRTTCPEDPRDLSTASDGGLEHIGIEGARLLADLLAQRPRDELTTLGIAWGRSTGRVVSCLQWMQLPELPKLDVIPLQGGIGRGGTSKGAAEFFPDILAEKLSRLFKSELTPSLITLPAYVDAGTADAAGTDGMKAIRNFIEADASIKRAREKYRSLDFALIGIGALEDGAWAIGSRYLPNSETVELLRSEKAVGDIVCRFFREQIERTIESHWDDSFVDVQTIWKTNQRAIGISLAELRERAQAGARILAVAGGKGGSKAAALRAGLMNGFVTDLVTDEITALSMLEARRQDD